MRGFDGWITCDLCDDLTPPEVGYFDKKRDFSDVTIIKCGHGQDLVPRV